MVRVPVRLGIRVGGGAGGHCVPSVGFAIYLDQFIPLSAGARTAVSLTLVCGLSIINAVGVQEGVWVQRIFTSLKILGLALVIAVAIFAPAHASAARSDAPPLTYAGIGIAMAACLMAYNGWSYVSFVAGEVKDPERNLPRSLALGMGIVMALYVSANLAYMHVMALPEIAASERVGAAVAERVMGPAGATVLSAVVLMSIIGAINGCILTGARIPFAQARDGLFFANFGRIHPRFQTPAFAIAMQALWTCLLIVTGSYQSLSSYTIISAWIFYTMSVAAVWVLRRKVPEAARPYRMWGYPVTLWMFIAVSMWFLVDALVNQPKVSLIALALAAAGIPAYLLWRRKTPMAPRPSSRMIW